VRAVCDVTIWRHIHVSKPTFWRSFVDAFHLRKNNKVQFHLYSLFIRLSGAPRVVCDFHPHRSNQGGQGGNCPTRFQHILSFCALTGGVPNKTSLLALTHKLSHLPKFWAGYATAHVRMLTPWATWLLSQWMLHWWRVNGSNAREPFPCTFYRAWGWTRLKYRFSSLWYSPDLRNWPGTETNGVLFAARAQQHIDVAEAKGTRRHLQRNPPPLTRRQGSACTTCGRVCDSAFGIRSHLRRHKETRWEASSSIRRTTKRERWPNR